MRISRSDLTETFRVMSDDELLQRWASGHLTQMATEVARAELLRRGVEPPGMALPEGSGAALGKKPAVAFVTIARSFAPVELQILRARLEGDGIPSVIVDEDINRMNSLWSIAVGGARLLVPQPFAAAAKQIIDLLNSGALAVRDGDDTG
jgi:hypothetical protein